MITKIILFFGLIIGIFMGVSHSIQSRSLLRYLDTHPHPTRVPAAQYYIGQGLYIFQNLSEASTYLIRVPEQYPSSRYADNALYGYIQCLEDDPTTTRDRLVFEYQRYIEKFPEGKHATVAMNRLDAFKSSAR